MIHYLSMLDRLVIKLERDDNNLAAPSSTSLLPVCLAPLSCKLQYHTHLEWNTDQSRSAGRTSVPVLITNAYYTAEDSSDV